jgi:hypothetical protein
MSEPLKFLGATVLSFNADLGLGSAESTLQVELVEDCEAGDLFELKTTSNNYKEVGAPAFFSAGSFNFGGIIQSFNSNKSGSGSTFSVRVVDPRQLLANCVVVTDTYLKPFPAGPNYFNVYAQYEQQVLNENCNVFGSSMSGERGMPYQKVIDGLETMNPTIYSPTGYDFLISFSSFPQGLPPYYRVAGPSVTLLQLLEDVCDVLGYDFYVNLLPNNIIVIGLIDLKVIPSSFENLVAQYEGIATEFSYGQELRNETTKSILFGEQVHYMSNVDKFIHFFGEDMYGATPIPVVPYSIDDCGFWISKKIDSLNAALNTPFNNNGPYDIHELDIRCAMSSFDIWLLRISSPDLSGSFNKLIQNRYPQLKDGVRKALQDAIGAANVDGVPPKSAVDLINNPRKCTVFQSQPDILAELDIIWRWIKQLGDTYYGKQFISPLNQTICYYQLDNDPLAERIFSDIPTNAGGWVDGDIPVLGLNEPELSLFRENDNRIGCFALFNAAGNTPPSNADTSIGGSNGFIGYEGDANPIGVAGMA